MLGTFTYVIVLACCVVFCVGEAPAPVCVGPNEEYSTCKRSCPSETCESTVVATYCAPEPCGAGCVCRAGHLRRHPAAPCRPRCRCPQIANTTQCRRQPHKAAPPACGINEEFSTCKRSCPPETCISTVVAFRCIEEPCRAGCVCKRGFLRKDHTSPCAPRCHCPQIRNTTQCLPQPDCGGY